MMNKKERPELLADLAQLRLKQAELESLLGIEGDIAAPLKILDSDIQSQPIIFYSEILNKIPGLAYYKDKHGVYIMANLAFTNALGLDLEQIVGKTDFDLIPVEKAERYWLEDQRILSGLDPILVIEEDILSEGHPICISYRKAPLKDHKGQIVGLIGVGFDISEHKLIEKELEQERLLIRTVIDNIPDQIFVRDRNCRFVLNNLSDARVMGVEDPETLVGKSDDDYYPANLSASYQADDRQVMDSGQPLINREELSISAEGQQRWVSTTKVPLQDVNGEVVGLVGIARDNTESKKKQTIVNHAARPGARPGANVFDA